MTQEESNKKIACLFLDWFCANTDEQVTNALNELPAFATTKEVYDLWLERYFNPETELIEPAKATNQ